MSPSTPQPHKFLRTLVPYVPGQSSLKGRQTSYKLSSNESALGPSPKAVGAYRSVARQLLYYPDGATSDLRRALARRHGVDEARIVCGNGSGELVQLLARALLAPGLKAVYSQHGFLLYGQSARLCQAEACPIPEQALYPDLAAMAKAAQRHCPLVFLANPNNPTASFVPLSALRTWHKTLPASTLLVLDYAYGEYLPATELHGVYRWAKTKRNIAVLGTFSKAYGLAALRVGWAYLPAHIADVLQRMREPFNVSRPGQHAAIVALADTAHLTKVVTHTRRWQQWLVQQLSGLGLRVHGRTGNFVMVEFDNPTQAQRANASLLAAGVIVRQLGAYDLPHCLRISIGSAPAMRAVVRAMTQFSRPTASQRPGARTMRRASK